MPNANFRRLGRRLGAEHGAGVVSLLAVLASVAIIGVVAVPALTKGGSSSTNQTAAATGAAQDVQAKNLLLDAQTAIASYASSNTSGYSGATPATLAGLEPTIVTSSTTQAYLASVTASADSYTLVAVDPLTGNSFTLANTSGAVSRTCTASGRDGCPAGGTW